MFRKTIFITALCMSSVTLSGCSSIWTGVSEFSAEMAEVTKFSFLRGRSDKSDFSFAENAENTEPVDGVHKTEVGEYVPVYVKVADVEPVQVELFENVSAVSDTSPLPCPEGTFLNAENACMFLEVEEFEFEDDVNMVEQFVDTSPLPCPDGTYLNAENACMFLEVETFEFEDDVNFVEQFVDTSPLPCPDGTYLNAKNACMYLEVENFDFAETQSAEIQTSEIQTAQTQTTGIQTVETQTHAPVGLRSIVQQSLNDTQVSFKESTLDATTACPEGFNLQANNTCMYLGAELQVNP